MTQGEISVFSAPATPVAPATLLSSRRPATRGPPTTPRSPTTAASSRSRSRPATSTSPSATGRSTSNVHDASTGATVEIDAPDHEAGLLALRLQPVAVGRRPAARVLGGRARRPHRRSGCATCRPAAIDLATPRPAGAPAGDAYGGRLAGDGRSMVFTWVPRDGSASHVYLRDLETGATALVDRASGAEGAVGNGFASHPAVSGDGRWVALSSVGTESRRRPAKGVRVYLRDRARGTTTQVSRIGDGSRIRARGLCGRQPDRLHRRQRRPVTGVGARPCRRAAPGSSDVRESRSIPLSPGDGRSSRSPPTAATSPHSAARARGRCTCTT